MPDFTFEKALQSQGFSAICGVDEAGRGPLCGSVVAAACILPHDVDLPGLNDSKKLTPKKREALFDLICERAIAFGHYDRNNGRFITESEELFPYFNIPLGGMKGRANQLCTAMARVQLKYYDARCAEIRRAMNYFWDLLEGLPGIRAIRVDERSGSNMAGWYAAHGLYVGKELEGLSVKRFCEAVRAEGGIAWDGGNYCLHTHALFRDYDYFGIGKPTRIAFAERDARVDDHLCTRSVETACFSVPWFKKFDKEWIEYYAMTFRKVIENYRELLDGDTGRQQEGRWHGHVNDQG